MCELVVRLLLLSRGMGERRRRRFLLCAFRLLATPGYSRTLTLLLEGQLALLIAVQSG